MLELADVDSWRGRFVNPEDDVDTDFHGIRIIYRVRIVGGTLRDEVGGSSDTCAWVRRDDAASLRLVELAAVGMGLAFGRP